MLLLREYQKRSLDALQVYLGLVAQDGAKRAFVIQTERPYRSVHQLPELPYVCLRVPTGGGKTLMACHALGMVAKTYLQREKTVCLWLVPSNAIREQTLGALRGRGHPYRQVIDEQFEGLVRVMDITEALQMQQNLEKAAEAGEKISGEYIRPIILFQAQPKNQDKSTLTVEVVKKTLIEDFKISEEEIAIATGQTHGIDNVDIFARACPIRYITTVYALKEGWDCSYAYILCSLAEMGSSRAVEQILGRILRLPGAKRKTQDPLNWAYAFVASPKFLEAANSLKDALIENGFQKMEEEFPSKKVSGATGQVDVDDEGMIAVQFVHQIQEQISWLTGEAGWTMAALSNWIDRQIYHPDIPQAYSSLFIHKSIENLNEKRGLTIEKLAREKFRLRNALADKIQEYRLTQHKKAYQQALFGSEALPVQVGPELILPLSEEAYSPNWYYEGSFKFQKHYFKHIGELRSEGEEFECAVFLDGLSQIKYWVRNLERRKDTSFWLQTASDRFYPDFLALLEDGRVLAVEYKGEHLWSNDDSKEKRAVGALWAEKSNRKCLFVMSKGTDWACISSKIMLK